VLAYHAAEFGPVDALELRARWAPGVAAGLAEAHASAHLYLLNEAALVAGINLSGHA